MLLFSTNPICLMSSIFSFYDITGTIGPITLGGAIFIGTLSGGTVIGPLWGATIGTSLQNTSVLVLFHCCGCMLSKGVNKLSMTFNCLSLIMKGFLGPGLFIICNNYLAALVDCSVVDNPGLMGCCGKKATTSACLSPNFVWCISSIAHLLLL